MLPFFRRFPSGDSSLNLPNYAGGGRGLSTRSSTSREAMARAADKRPLCLVSAWATANHVVLGQVAGPPGSSELGAMPKLLELLELRGAIVTLDALGCQTEIVKQIVQQDGDYVIAVKGSPPMAMVPRTRAHAITSAACRYGGRERSRERCGVIGESRTSCIG
jgi:hypothetical protein